jgi:antitoxin component YwqK of YwqJK toxin-antitoxin module
MKYLILLFFLIPKLAFGQIKLENLARKNGIAYEQGATLPFTGKAFLYFPNGDIKSFFVYKNGVMDGETKSWYSKDKLQIEGFITNGKQAGTWKVYFDNGKLKKQANYQNGKQNGEETFWFENGNRSKKGSYLDGTLNGKYEWYFENGQKKQEGFFVIGKEDSIWSEWFENGMKKMVGHFTNLEKNGEWTWWDESGKVTKAKKYINGLVTVEKDDFDTYVEKMEFFLVRRNFKESVKNVELAEKTIKDKTESNSIFMGLSVYHSKCYSAFSHYRQAEKILLDAIGLSNNQIKIIQNSHLEKSPTKINQLIQEITKIDKSKFLIGNHIAIGLCYNILGDTVHLKEQQQVTMEKGQMQDWIYKVSLELYKLAGERFNNYLALEDINNTITKNVITPKLELDKAHYLIRNEKFEEAQTIIDKCLKTDEKNLSALLLKADIEMAFGNVEKMKIYEDKAALIAVPEAFLKQK